MDSRLLLEEKVKNRDRRFGSCLEYYPTKVIMPSGEEKPALFTRDQIKDALDRAARNPEDVPGRSFWDRILYG